MAEIARLNGHREWIDLGFLERERTPEPAMALGIQAHVAGLSLSNTVELLATLGVQRSRKAIHDWVQKAELQPESGKEPNQIALDETVIRINNHSSGRTPQLIRKRTNCFTSGCFQRLRPLSPRCFSANFGKSTMSKLPYLSSMALNTSKQHFNELASDFRYIATEIGTLSNGFFES